MGSRLPLDPPSLLLGAKEEPKSLRRLRLFPASDADDSL